MGYPMPQRGTSPAAVGMVGAVPMNLRNTIGHVPGHLRTSSPVGLAPNSPTGSVSINGATVAFASGLAGAAAQARRVEGALATTSRGRSPPPSAASAGAVSAAAAAGAPPPGALLRPRAATPSALVPPGLTTQGLHAAQRSSLGGAPLVMHRGP